MFIKTSLISENFEKRGKSRIPSRDLQYSDLTLYARDHTEFLYINHVYECDIFITRMENSKQLISYKRLHFKIILAIIN